MEKRDMQLAYMQEIYIKLDRLARNQDKETWLVKNNIDKKLYVWKETGTEMISIYQKLKDVYSKNLVPVTDVVRAGNKAIIIKEYISGSTLQELLQYGTIKESLAADIVFQLLEVLSIIHSQNIVHRDITPQNVLISTDGIVKLLDFGIAREPKDGKEEDTALLGTAGYAAPEQFGFRQTDGRSDIYSLGVLFHVMLTGKLPKGKLCCKPQYQDFILKCIALEPEKRYQSALEAYKALEYTIKRLDMPESAYSQEEVKNIQESLAHNQKETKVTEEKRANPYILPGFRSNTLWKKLLAGFFYAIMGIYIVASLAECAVTPLSFFLEFSALMLYFVLSFICLANYGDWIHRIKPFARLNRKWEMLIRVILFCILFTYGFELEQYVRITMLGLKK